MIEIFEKWFENLSDSDKKILLSYIAKKYSLNEGYFSGPSAYIEKGLYTDSGNVSNKICPTCKRAI